MLWLLNVSEHGCRRFPHPTRVDGQRGFVTLHSPLKWAMVSIVESDDLGIVDGLVQLSFLVQSILARVATGYDVSVVQVRMLGVLRGRRVGMAQLAKLLNLDKSSMTGLVDRAERRGFVERVPVAADGRVVHVVLTEHGTKIAEAFAYEVADQIAAAVDGLSETNRKRLSSLASRVVVHDAVTLGLDLKETKP